MPNDSRPSYGTERRSSRHVAILGALVFLSGMAALTHQLLWTRRLIDLLGASTESTARVFGIFFLGLAFGSAIAALLADRIRNPYKVAGFAQLAIPFLVIPVIYLSELTDWIWPLMGSDRIQGSGGDLLKAMITLAFVFPPSAVMGISFPLIVSGSLHCSKQSLARLGMGLYATNTVGGAVGILFTIMWAMPRIGNFNLMFAAALLDGLVGISLLLLSRSNDFSTYNSDSANSVACESTKSPVLPICLAFFSGMTVLALEVSAFQMFQLVATISIFAPAAILFSVIATLGVSAAFYSKLQGRL
ncbi:MAG: hypothetical protein AAF664_23535, partial [Planctomycetota bacterium]